MNSLCTANTRFFATGKSNMGMQHDTWQLEHGSTYRAAGTARSAWERRVCGNLIGSCPGSRVVLSTRLSWPTDVPTVTVGHAAIDEE